MNKFRTSLIVLVTLLLLAGSAFIYFFIVYRTEISEFQLTANDEDRAGLAPQGHFLLKTTASLTPQVIEKYLSTDPYVEMVVKKAPLQKNTFLVIPKDPLTPDHIYTLAIKKGPLANHDFSWAYQVRAPFKVISSLPRDKSIDVPINTGVEIDFNREDIIAPERYIEVSPPTLGRFEVREGKVQFIPHTPLKEKTIYTFTIKKGTKAKDAKDSLDKDVRIQFQTASSYKSTATPAYFSRQFTEFAPETDITLGVWAPEQITSIPVTVFQLTTADAYISSVKKVQGGNTWARYFPTNAQIPESKKVFSGNLPLVKNNYSSFVRLPQVLQPGYYMAVTTKGEAKDISWFQINPTASFAAFSSLTSLVWLKDIASKKSVKDIALMVDTKKIGTTGEDGVATFATPSHFINNDASNTFVNDRKFLVAQTSDLPLVIPLENEYGYQQSLGKHDSYWEYISLNKNVYLPNDTVRFWAIEKRRDSKEYLSGEVEVTLTSPYWHDKEENIVTYASTMLPVSSYHTITGELSFSNLKPGLYELTFRKAGETIAKKTLSVGAYIQPAYKIILTPDKNVVFAGEKVTFTARAQFFDGTPVTNIVLAYSAYGFQGKDARGVVQLNREGTGSFSLNPTYSDNQAQWPSYMAVTVYPSKAEEGQIETSASVFVFGSHVNNTIGQKEVGSSTLFTVETREVVLGNPSRGDPYWDKEQYLGSSISDVSTDVRISEVIYHKEQVGTNYDAISKTTSPVYDYRTENRQLSTKKIRANEKGIAEIVFTPEKEKTYMLTFVTHDTVARGTKDVRYVYGGSRKNSASDEYYILNNKDENTKKYKIGDPVNLVLQTKDGNMPQDEHNGYLFMTVNNGDIKYQIQDTPKYSASFQESDLPNSGIWPGWFSNGRFHNSYLQNISFDSNERRLSVSVVTDKKQYKPGDRVALTISVSDKDGHPVSSEVNLSALDDAVFAIKPDEQDIVEDLYKDLYSQVVIRTSNMPPYGGGGAEKGGGGDQLPRSDLQEIAIWKTVTTGSDGKANVEFTLPDNITSWRLTAQAVTKTLFAGKSTVFIPVTLPFFVDATLNKTYLLGDDVVVRLRAFGIGNSEGNATQYSVKSETLPFQSMSKNGSDSVEVKLGNLALGDHELYVRAASGIFSDALTKKFSVRTSYFEKKSTLFYEGKQGLRIKNNAIQNTTLTFSSYLRGQLYDQLKALDCECGIRLDERGAGVVADELLNSYFGESYEKFDFYPDKYQSYTGGLQLLPYSSEDLKLSALAAHVFEKDVFDAPSLKGYFYTIISNPKTDLSQKILALYGLSAFREPVLQKAQNIKNNKNLTIEDKIFIALTLDSLGAKEESRAYYMLMIKPTIIMSEGYAYIGGLRADATSVYTMLAATLAASLEEQESSALILYARQNPPTMTRATLEELLYLRAVLPKLILDEEVNFSYMVGGNKQTKTLRKRESHKISLTKEELSTFQLDSASGKLGIVATYEEATSTQSIIKDKNLSLSRSYEVGGVATKQFREGDLVLVRLTPWFTVNALNGLYQIVDYVPSGLRPIDQESVRDYTAYDTRVYPVEINNQKVTFLVEKGVTLSIYYYARVISKGTYKAEPALLQSLQSVNSQTVSNEESVLIK